MAHPKKKNIPSDERMDAIFLEPGSHIFKEIFDHADDAMLALHGHGVTQCYVNRSACEMTGYNLGELMNLGFKELVHPEELDKIQDRFEKRRKGIDLPDCYEK